jgi:hypothetical protein
MAALENISLASYPQRADPGLNAHKSTGLRPRLRFAGVYQKSDRIAAMVRQLVAILLMAAVSVTAESMFNGRRATVLEGGSAQVVVDLGGGSIVDFHLLDQKLNPLVWGDTKPTPEPRAMGQFLCLDRWGAPSAAELRNGMVFHGEATKVDWKELSATKTEAELSASLPMAGLTVRRRIRIHENSAVFTVSESVTNENKLGRIYNQVQHATIGPPFLDEHTVVDSNARKGFMQSSPLPNPEEPSVVWPQALKDGQPVDMRHLAGDPNPNVVSYTIDEPYGWVTASNETKGLLIGYIWKTSDFPWFNAWRHVQNGKPLARGLEFGTTGLHQPFPILVEKGKIFGRPIFAYLDAGQTATRSYTAFLSKIPKDYRGVGRVQYENGRLTIYERGAEDGKGITIETGN